LLARFLSTSPCSVLFHLARRAKDKYPTHPFTIVAGQNTESALNKTKVPTLSVFKACLAKNDEAQKEKKSFKKAH
jgi:hypothetical protein